jgi:hypothetical protein
MRDFHIEYDDYWTRDRITAHLLKTKSSDCPEERFRMLAQPFIDAETPYIEAAAVPSAAPNVLSLRMSAFSCSSFIHFISAWAHADGYEEFVQAIIDMRYEGELHPKCYIHDLNLVMCKMIEYGIAIDVADQFSADAMLPLKGHGRYFPIAKLAGIESKLKCGDILFFVSAEEKRQTLGLISHSGFVYKFPDNPNEAFLLHAGAAEWNQSETRKGCVALAKRTRRRAGLVGAVQKYDRLSEYVAHPARCFSGLAILRLTRL